MGKTFIKTVEEVYKNNSNTDEVYKHFEDLGYKRRRITTALSDLRRYKKIKVEYKKQRKNNVFDPKIQFKEILLLDIETTPLKGWVWSKWNNDIHGDQLIQEWFILSWALKSLNSDVIESSILYPEEILNEDDSRIIKHIHSKMKKAKIIIAHNARKFDIKRLNTRFIYHNLPPLDYKTIDTLDEARKNFNFTSNRLDDLAKFFNIEGKNKTDFSLWDRCMKGDETSLEEMRIYNVQDVNILEQVYLRLRPYMKHHPNLNNMFNLRGCSSCGSINIERDGFYYTNTSKYPRYKCNNCGSLSRGRLNTNDKDKMKDLLVSI